jgi:very-short-patch-repair endonuclease
MQREHRSREWSLAALAGKQHGVVAYRQLIALGLGPSAIAYRLRIGRLHRVHRGVYSVGHPNLVPEGREMAAVLACGPASALSHWSAAGRWGILRARGAVVDVVVGGRAEGRQGIRIHRASSLHPHDFSRRDGIPITSVSRTLLDLAAVAPPRTLGRAINEADRQGRLNRRAMQEQLVRDRGRRGAKRLRAVLAATHPATRRTRSDLEILFLELCRRHCLPTPRPNVKIHGIEVDFHFPGTRLIVEIDGYEYHRTAAEFDNDRRRDARLKALGYEVVRVSDAWLVSDPRGVAAAVRALLQR